jgi:magnesium transporter
MEEATLIRAQLYSPDTDIVTGGKELKSAWQENPGSILWLDISGEPESSESSFLCESFGLHTLAVQDAQRKRHPPKLEAFDATTFIILKVPDTDSTDLHFSTTQLAIFIGDGFMITRRSGNSPDTDSLFQQAADDAPMYQHGAAGIALRLCRRVSDRYIKLLLTLEPRLDEIEDVIMQHPDDKLLAELLSYKTELKKFRRLFLYHQQIFQELKSGSFPAFRDANRHVIIDVFEHLERASSLASLYHELTTDLIDGYISVASHNLNQIMKILTVVMSIFIPLSFLAGIYGMNFENMPELHAKSGYFILLGVMFSIVIILITLFRRMRWL